MNFFIDESGLFVPAPAPHSWCFVGGIACTDDDYNRAKSLLKNLKSAVGRGKHEEIKLRDIPEKKYFEFLQNLSRLDVTFFATGTDSHLNTPEIIKWHQAGQANAAIAPINKMNFPEGREYLLGLKRRIEALPPQLYAQLFCQIDLLFEATHQIIPYYVQRKPESLSSLRIKIDQKDISKTLFEEAFELLSPEIMQSRSMQNPLVMIEGCDYSALQKYTYTRETIPKYFKETYGLDIEGGINIQKMIRENFELLDSKYSPGIQIADLLTSGLRRLFRQRFSDNNSAAIALGKMMVSAPRGRLPIHLITMAPHQSYEGPLVELSEQMANNSKPFISTELYRQHRKEVETKARLRHKFGL